MNEKDTDNWIASSHPDKKLTFAIESYKEAMNNLRHYQSTSLRVVTWALTSLAVLSGWLLQHEGLKELTERIALTTITVGYVGSIFLIQHNCSKLSRQAHNAILHIDLAFQCFEEGAYRPSAPLFPMSWSKAKRQPFVEKVSTSLMTPLIIGLAITLGVVFLR